MDVSLSLEWELIIVSVNVSTIVMVIQVVERSSLESYAAGMVAFFILNLPEMSCHSFDSAYWLGKKYPQLSRHDTLPKTSRPSKIPLWHSCQVCSTMGFKNSENGSSKYWSAILPSPSQPRKTLLVL